MTTLIFIRCESPPPPPPPCPFPLLSFRHIDYKEEGLLLEFATEIGIEIQSLKKNLGDASGQLKMGHDINSTIKHYAERGIASDSIFVGYYNAFVSSACNRWYLYKDNPSDQNGRELKETLSAIDEFIANYNINIDNLAFIEQVKSLQDRLTSFSESVKQSNQIDDISKRNYLRKIIHMQNVLSSINPIEPTNKDKNRLNEVDLRYSSLQRDFIKGRNF